MIVRVSGHSLVADPRVLLRVIRDEAVATPRPLRLWYGLLGLLLLVGAVGAVRALFPGDKGIGTTPTFEWGLLIVAYVFFAITTSGLCLASSLGTVFGIDRFRPLEKRHAILAVLCLVTAFGVIALDLHYPVRLVFGAALNPSLNSPMWWMGVFYGIYLCFLLTEVWSIFWHHERIHSIACLLSSVMAVIAPGTLGAVFGVLAARPYWTGVFTPILMVASALLAGTALLGIVFYAVTRLRLDGFERAGALAIPAIRSVLVIALVMVAVLVARQVIVGLLASDPGLSAATDALISGPLAVQFVGVRVIIGLVLPLAILVLPWTRSARGVLVAGCLAIVGVFTDRLSFVSAGQIAPTTATSGVVSAPYAAYTPSLVEVSILVGAVAFVALVYTLAERYLDLRESEIHIGFPLLLRLGRMWSERTHAVAPAAALPAPAAFEPVMGPIESAEPAAAAEPEAGEPGPEPEAAEAAEPEPEPAEAVEPETGVAGEPELAEAAEPEIAGLAEPEIAEPGRPEPVQLAEPETEREPEPQPGVAESAITVDAAVPTTDPSGPEVTQ
jgi:molybdopterin-containing oxidoreductase family membrane subunit